MRPERMRTVASSKKPIFGLLGHTLAHSYSPKIHSLLGSYEYRLFEVEPENLESFVKNGEYARINVTMPYKEAVMPMCDELSDAARIIGCVNTIVRKEDGRLYGDNTDYYGFSHLVEFSGVPIEGRKVLVLGAGGASKTVCSVMTDRGAREVAVVSRSLPGAGLNTIEDHYDADIIVNATPVGMYPNCPESLVNIEPFTIAG